MGGGIALSVLGFSVGVYLSLTGSTQHQEREPVLGEYRFLFESEALKPNRSSFRNELSDYSNYNSPSKRNSKEKLGSPKFKESLSKSELMSSSTRLAQYQVN